jgi:cytoskeletal protein CcmA (bactofilin family)
MTVGGRLIADRFAIGADSEVLGEVTVREALTITGESRFGGPVRAGELRIHGRLQAGGPITVERNLLLVGRLETPGDVTVGGDLSFDGSLASPGSVRARSVEGRQRGRGEAGNLVAEVVRIRRPGGFGPSNGRFDILRIEAREVHLEGVRCEYLRAERVHLGPGCHVVRLDGNLIQKHRSSYVGPEAPFERPRGMFR